MTPFVLSLPCRRPFFLNAGWLNPRVTNRRARAGGGNFKAVRVPYPPPSLPWRGGYGAAPHSGGRVPSRPTALPPWLHRRARPRAAPAGLFRVLIDAARANASPIADPLAPARATAVGICLSRDPGLDRPSRRDRARRCGRMPARGCASAPICARRRSGRATPRALYLLSVVATNSGSSWARRSKDRKS